MPRRRPSPPVRPLKMPPKPKPQKETTRIAVTLASGAEEVWTAASFTVAEVGLLAILNGDERVVVAYGPGQWTRFTVGESQSSAGTQAATVAESSRSERESEGGVEADDE